MSEPEETPRALIESSEEEPESLYIAPEATSTDESEDCPRRRMKPIKKRQKIRRSECSSGETTVENLADQSDESPRCQRRASKAKSDVSSTGYQSDSAVATNVPSNGLVPWMSGYQSDTVIPGRGNFSRPHAHVHANAHVPMHGYHSHATVPMQGYANGNQNQQVGQVYGSHSENILLLNNHSSNSSSGPAHAHPHTHAHAYVPYGVNIGHGHNGQPSTMYVNQPPPAPPGLTRPGYVYGNQCQQQFPIYGTRYLSPHVNPNPSRPNLYMHPNGQPFAIFHRPTTPGAMVYCAQPRPTMYPIQQTQGPTMYPIQQTQGPTMYPIQQTQGPTMYRTQLQPGTTMYSPQPQQQRPMIYRTNAPQGPVMYIPQTRSAMHANSSQGHCGLAHRSTMYGNGTQPQQDSTMFGNITHTQSGPILNHNGTQQDPTCMYGNSVQTQSDLIRQANGTQTQSETAMYGNSAQTQQSDLTWPGNGTQTQSESAIYGNTTHTKPVSTFYGNNDESTVFGNITSQTQSDSTLYGNGTQQESIMYGNNAQEHLDSTFCTNGTQNQQESTMYGNRAQTRQESTTYSNTAAQRQRQVDSTLFTNGNSTHQESAVHGSFTQTQADHCTSLYGNDNGTQQESIMSGNIRRAPPGYDTFRGNGTQIQCESRIFGSQTQFESIAEDDESQLDLSGYNNNDCLAEQSLRLFGTSTQTQNDSTMPGDQTQENSIEFNRNTSTQYDSSMFDDQIQQNSSMFENQVGHDLTDNHYDIPTQHEDTIDGQPLVSSSPVYGNRTKIQPDSTIHDISTEAQTETASTEANDANTQPNSLMYCGQSPEDPTTDQNPNNAANSQQDSVIYDYQFQQAGSISGTQSLSNLSVSDHSIRFGLRVPHYSSVALSNGPRFPNYANIVRSNQSNHSNVTNFVNSNRPGLPSYANIANLNPTRPRVPSYANIARTSLLNVPNYSNVANTNPNGSGVGVPTYASIAKSNQALCSRTTYGNSSRTRVPTYANIVNPSGPSLLRYPNPSYPNIPRNTNLRSNRSELPDNPKFTEPRVIALAKFVKPAQDFKMPTTNYNGMEFLGERYKIDDEEREASMSMARVCIDSLEDEPILRPCDTDRQMEASRVLACTSTANDNEQDLSIIPKLEASLALACMDELKEQDLQDSYKIDQQLETSLALVCIDDRSIHPISTDSCGIQNLESTDDPKLEAPAPAPLPIITKEQISSIQRNLFRNDQMEGISELERIEYEMEKYRYYYDPSKIAHDVKRLPARNYQCPLSLSRSQIEASRALANINRMKYQESLSTDNVDEMAKSLALACKEHPSLPHRRWPFSVCSQHPGGQQLGRNNFSSTNLPTGSIFDKPSPNSNQRPKPSYAYPSCVRGNLFTGEARICPMRAYPNNRLQNNGGTVNRLPIFPDLSMPNRVRGKLRRSLSQDQLDSITEDDFDFDFHQQGVHTREMGQRGRGIRGHHATQHMNVNGGLATNVRWPHLPPGFNFDEFLGNVPPPPGLQRKGCYRVYPPNMYGTPILGLGAKIPKPISGYDDPDSPNYYRKIFERAVYNADEFIPKTEKDKRTIFDKIDPSIEAAYVDEERKARNMQFFYNYRARHSRNPLGNIFKEKVFASVVEPPPPVFEPPPLVLEPPPPVVDDHPPLFKTDEPEFKDDPDMFGFKQFRVQMRASRRKKSRTVFLRGHYIPEVPMRKIKPSKFLTYKSHKIKRDKVKDLTDTRTYGDIRNSITDSKDVSRSYPKIDHKSHRKSYPKVDHTNSYRKTRHANDSSELTSSGSEDYDSDTTTTSDNSNRNDYDHLKDPNSRGDFNCEMSPMSESDDSHNSTTDSNIDTESVVSAKT